MEVSKLLALSGRTPSVSQILRCGHVYHVFLLAVRPSCNVVKSICLLFVDVVIMMTKVKTSTCYDDVRVLYSSATQREGERNFTSFTVSPRADMMLVSRAKITVCINTFFNELRHCTTAMLPHESNHCSGIIPKRPM